MPEIVLELFGAVAPLFLLLLIPLYFWSKLIHESLHSKDTHPESFERTVGWLRENRFGVLYFFVISKVLEMFTKLTNDGCGSGSVKENYFNKDAYEFCLKLAFIYPMVLYFLSEFFNFSLLTRAEGGFALTILFSLLLFSVFILVIEVYKNRALGGFKYVKNQCFKLIKYVKGASLLYLYLLIVLFLAALLSGADVITFIMLLMMLMIVVVTFSIVSLKGFKIFGSVIPMILLLSLIMVAFIYQGEIEGALVILIFLWVGIITMMKVGSGSVYFWLGMNVFFAALAYAVMIATQSTPALMFILLLVLFPLVNAPLDWLSLAVTRSLLSEVQSGSHRVVGIIAFAAMDLLLALVLLFLITGALIGVVSLGNAIVGRTLVDLHEILLSIQNSPESVSHWWIYLMLLSTFIPTLIHIAIVGGAVTLWLPRKSRLIIADRLDQDVHKTFVAWAYLTFTPMIGFIIMPGILLYSLWKLVTAEDALLVRALLSWVKMLTDYLVTVG